MVKALVEFIGVCGAGRVYAALDPDYSLMPCVFMPIRIGNLRKIIFLINCGISRHRLTC